MELRTFSYSVDNQWDIQAFPKLDSENTLVLVFGSSGFIDNPEPIQQLANAYPQAQICGCSTSGEIFGTEISDNSLSVAVLRFSRTRLRTATAEVQQASDSWQAGKTLARELATPDLRSVLVLSDGLQVNGSTLVEALNSELADDVVITGGLAGDADRFQRTWVLQRDQPTSGIITAVAFYGDAIRVGHGSRGGWDIFGPERHVTRSHGNILYELDGQPALALYKRYLGELASGLPATALRFPLSIRNAENGDNSIVRTILAVDEDNQSLTFAGDIPQGSIARLMHANFERLIEGAANAALMTRETMPDPDGPVLAIAISCVGRRLVLGDASEDEVESTIDILPDGTRQIGFYSYGEISPYSSGRCELHNQTMTLTTISEAA